MGMKQNTEPPPVSDRGAPTYFITGMLPVEHAGNGNLVFTYVRHDNSIGTTRLEVECRLVLHIELLAKLRRQTDCTVAAIHRITQPETVLLM